MKSGYFNLANSINMTILSMCSFFLLISSGFTMPITGVDNGSSRTQRVSLECETCRFLTTLLHNVWGDQAMTNCLVDVVVFICEEMHVADNFICTAMVSEFKAEYLYVLGELTKTPDDICGFLVHDCGNPFNPFNITWRLPIPDGKPAYQTLPQPSSEKPTLRVLHLSDIHLDTQYEIGSEADCDEPFCCRPANDTHEKNSVKNPAGPWGTNGKCDTPYWLFENAMQHIADAHNDALEGTMLHFVHFQIDYIVVSGDLESHADWDYTRETHIAIVANISATIKNAFPGIKVFFAVGNHEGVPIDNFAPHWTPPEFHMDWLYNAMAEAWRSWLPADQLELVRYRASYAVQLFPGLRLISINNGYGDNVNFFLFINETDPDGTMSWFLNQLLEAEQAGEKVHVVAHIPGGNDQALEGWAINYYEIVNRFENTVVGQFFGHTHSEQFFMMYLDPYDFRSRPTSVIYSAPSLTPKSDFNPAYRIYTVDGNYPGSTYQVLDFEDWYLNLTEANATPDANPIWKPLFRSVKTEYGMDAITYDNWNNLIERMKTDTMMMDKYVRNYFRRTDKQQQCDARCRAQMLCSARQAHSSTALCLDIPNLSPVKSRPSNLGTIPGPLPTFAELEDRVKALRLLMKDDQLCPPIA